MSVRYPSPRGDAAVSLDRSLIEALARDFGRTEHEVEVILQEELDRLAAQARISTFVTVLATSNVRTRLRQTGGSH
jgi:hypothetical protein